MGLLLSYFWHPWWAPMLCKAMWALSAIVYFISLYECLGFCTLFLYMAYWAYTTLLILQVLFSSHVRWNYKKGCALKTKTLTYYKYYNFIYSNTTVTVAYMYINITYLNLVLGVPPTHLYFLFACIEVSGKCWAKRRPIWIGLLLWASHLYRQGWCKWKR